MSNAIRRRWGGLIASVAGAAAALALTVGIAGPATAMDTTRDFNIHAAQRNAWDGQAGARGHIEFLGAHSFKLDVGVFDWCPGDGQGAYVHALILFKDGSWKKTGVLAKQTSGCGIGGNWTAPHVKTVKKIAQVEIVVVERDTDGSSGQRTESAQSNLKTNPYVR